MKVDEIIKTVSDLCREYHATEVILYGSGVARERSDIDIAVCGVRNFERLLDQIEKLPTLYSVDLLNMDTCKNELLLEDIKRYGRKI